MSVIESVSLADEFSSPLDSSIVPKQTDGASDLPKEELKSGLEPKASLEPEGCLETSLDNLAEQFSLSFGVESCLDSDQQLDASTSRPHPRFADYKRKNYEGVQARRRRDFLERQKRGREETFDLARKIADDALFDEEEEVDDGIEYVEEDELMDFEAVARPRDRSKRIRERTPKVMLSEWLIDVPSDFALSHYVVPCPKGRRNLVSAARGSTWVRNKMGVKIRSLPSHLPGGNRRQRYSKWGECRECTMLDCIFDEVDSVYYALDLMCWMGHPFLDCETEFRFAWLLSKFDENEKLGQKENINPCPFVRLPYFNCSPEGILAAVTYFPPSKLDGLLFYHKECHYHLGTTPLVGWLQVQMIPDMLGLPIPPEYRLHAAPGDPTSPLLPPTHPLNVRSDAGLPQDTMKDGENELTTKEELLTPNLEMD